MERLKSTNPNLTKQETAALSVMIISILAGFFYIFYRKKTASRPLAPSKKIDIEIRYDADKDADATMLAQNQVKIIRMVLTPLEKRILKEKAKLIYVYGGDFWEMRLRNASEQLKHSITKLLEAKEW